MALHQPRTGIDIVILMQLSQAGGGGYIKQCPKFKIYNILYDFFILRLKFPTTARLSIIALWSYVNFMCIE